MSGRHPAMTSTVQEGGAFVLSLDFELHWGVRDVTPPDGRYAQHLWGARDAVPKILALFEEFEVAATWATVGFLFAEDREELEDVCPQLKPQYVRDRLFPYDEKIGRNERDDPLHYAPSLIQTIASTARQEIGSHTFSHYYCLEQGQDIDTFRADLRSAVEIAKRRGIRLSSLVLPRNQVNSSYADAITDAGFTSYRGSQPGWIYNDAPTKSKPLKRVGRLVDTYTGVKSPTVFPWSHISERSGLCNVQASAFLRPYRRALGPLEKMRLLHARRAVRKAAVEQHLVHFWWHPHNFGVNTELQLIMLRELLLEVRYCREMLGMQSLSMREVARATLPAAGAKP